MRHLKNIGLILGCILGLALFFVGMSVGSLAGFGHFMVNFIGRPELGFSSHLFGFVALVGGMAVAGVGLGLMLGSIAWAGHVLKHGLFGGFFGGGAMFMLYAYFATYETSTTQGKGILLIFTALLGLIALLVVIIGIEEARKARKREKAFEWALLTPTERAKRKWGIK